MTGSLPLMSRSVLVSFFAFAAAACTDKGPSSQDVVENYAELVYQNYSDALAETKELNAAIDRFVNAPSPARLEFAKRTWLDARRVYGQTEVFRFYGGPIDDDKSGPEGRINGWPLDESYIDYVEGDSNAGIVNDPSIEITKQKLASFNEGSAGDILHRGQAFDPEKAIASGYHAIEFLLWGQDRSQDGPGQRSWQDYQRGGTTPHPERRAAYLQAASDLLVEDLEAVTQAWAPATDNYRKAFVSAPPEQSLKKILTGIGVLAKGELASERIDVALDTLDQEDEHSCFSDNTHEDIIANAKGLRNVYLGSYALHEGPGVGDLVRHKDPELDAKLRDLMNQVVAEAQEIPAPFDEAVKKRGTDGWNQANKVVTLLYDLGDQTVKAGQVLGLGQISVALPE